MGWRRGVWFGLAKWMTEQGRMERAGGRSGCWGEQGWVRLSPCQVSGEYGSGSNAVVVGLGAAAVLRLC